MIARQIGRDSVFPSIEIGTEDFTGYVGACDVGYSCAYMNTISWKSPTPPLPMETNPRVVFERMFGRPGSLEDRVERMQQNRSILDSVTGDVAALERGLGARDKRAARSVPRARPGDRDPHPARREPGHAPS